jgi:hypothetical protein
MTHPRIEEPEHASDTVSAPPRNERITRLSLAICKREIGCDLSSQYETRRPIFHCAFPQMSATLGPKLELVAVQTVGKLRKMTQPASYI